MGARRQRLPSGIGEIAEVIGERAALEFVLWRWARTAEQARAKGRPPPRAVCIHIPSAPAADHRIAEALGPEMAKTLAVGLGGEKVTCQVPQWLLDHFVTAAGLRDLASGVSPSVVAQRYGRHASAWSRLANDPPRHNPLGSINENITAECVHTILEGSKILIRKTNT